jgi:hypothetical protein
MLCVLERWIEQRSAELQNCGERGVEGEMGGEGGGGGDLMPRRRVEEPRVPTVLMMSSKEACGVGGQ